MLEILCKLKLYGRKRSFIKSAPGGEAGQGVVASRVAVGGARQRRTRKLAKVRKTGSYNQLYWRIG
jgi:hypothetical protein